MADQDKPSLHRALGFWALLAYGVGDILGAGIYTLAGKIAGMAGTKAWLAFGVAMAVASITALSYSELVGRYPKSGGEALFCERGYRPRWVAMLIGWLVFCSGVVSLSVMARAFAEQASGLELLSSMPSWATICLFMVVLGAINFWGIRYSSGANIVCTLVEMSGLVIVIVACVMFLSAGSSESTVDGAAAREAVENSTGAIGNHVTWLMVFQGAALAFFAFIGFEDMVNVAEEVKNPKRVFPRAIIAALLIAGSLYMLVVWLATQVVPPEQLGESSAPLLDVVHTAAPSVPTTLFTGIALFAIANTGLLNFITASRLVYGMADQGLLPRWLNAIHSTRRTPHRAILVPLVASGVLALSGTVSFLAGTTSSLLLFVFAAVNGALFLIKRKERLGKVSFDGFRVHASVPAAGVVVSLALIGFVTGSSLGAAGGILLVGVLIIAWRWRAMNRGGLAR